ncbi:MAG: JAB domain-containing protein [Gammaproteobacteria bacterium]
MQKIPWAVSDYSDRRLTNRLKEALGLIDIRTLDHFVIGGIEAVSFAERGLL